MAKKRGRLQEALKGFKQQEQKRKNAAAGPSSSSASDPPAKKQKKSHSTPVSSPSQPPKKKHKQVLHARPTIPFSPHDAILLIGEADLSFAASLVNHHKCTNLTATVLEKDEAELVSKYPHVPGNISTVLDSENKILYGIDARKMSPFLGPGQPKRGGQGAMDRIIFNFPHVGGKSTDVNRQVRYNQEMLVDFFRRALPSLAPGGSIVVTLFEGEPYTLWNIRDLARHAGGLEVERSFRFQAAAYPGYRHARTLGVVRNKKTGEEAKGAWKGEERAARSFVFVRKGEGVKNGKRKKESDDEEEVGEQRWDEEGGWSEDEGEEEEDGGEGAGGKPESEHGKPEDVAEKPKPDGDESAGDDGSESGGED